MISFQVNDMTCGRCVNTITKAVNALDTGAKVQIDLAAHRIDIETGATDAAGLAKVIRDAGYTPVAVKGVPAHAAPGPAAKRGACCCN